jgi:hypothetical protein
MGVGFWVVEEGRDGRWGVPWWVAAGERFTTHNVVLPQLITHNP